MIILLVTAILWLSC